MEHETESARRISPFSFRNRLGRFLWSIVQATLFRLSPRPFHKWRCLLLKAFGARIGPNVHPYPGLTVWAPWLLCIGENTGIADDVTIYNQAAVTIGDRSSISQGAYLCTGTHDYTDPAHSLYTRPIVIGSDVWIAARVFVHPGVTIHDGVVVGACSVVLKDLAAWSVFSGNPAKLIKPRKIKGS